MLQQGKLVRTAQLKRPKLTKVIFKDKVTNTELGSSEITRAKLARYYSLGLCIPKVTDKGAFTIVLV